MKISDKAEFIYKALKHEILSCHHNSGEKLPYEMELAATFGVARGTLRKALTKLEEENLIVRIKHKGTFVSESITRPKGRM